MRMDALIVIALWTAVMGGLVWCFARDHEDKKELRARHAAELAALRKDHQMELARVAAKYCQAVNCAEDRAAEAKTAAEEEIRRLKLDNKALREVLRTMEEKQRRAAS